MAETRLTMKLIKATHATDIAAALAATSENGGEVKTEAAAVSELSALRLSGLGLRAIENLEPFDRCEALYLDHNEIDDIENLECLGRRLRLLSLRHNQLTSLGCLGQLTKLEVLDLAHNRLELPKASASSSRVARNESKEGSDEKNNTATWFAQSLPSNLRILDYRGNPALETGEVWASVVQALPWCHELNGSIVTRQQRLECLGPSKFKEEWGTHPAATSKKHALFVRVQAERPGEVSHTAKVVFHAGDDIEAIAQQFCVDHAISNPAEAARDIVAQMVELIDAPQATSLPLKSKTATRRVAHEASKENSEDKKKQEEKEEVDGATSFVSRLKAFYAKYDPTKLETDEFIDGIVKKYGGSAAQEAKLMAAMVKKYGPEPLQSHNAYHLKNTTAAAGDIPVEASADSSAAEEKKNEAAEEEQDLNGGSSAFAAAEDALSEATSRVHERLASTRQRLEERRRARRETAAANGGGGGVNAPFDEDEETKEESDQGGGGTVTSMTYASMYASAQQAAAAQKENYEAGKAARADMRSEVLAKVDSQVRSLFQREVSGAKENKSNLVRVE